MLRSLPLPPCFISSVYRWVAAGPGDSNRWLWVSSASLERWRCRDPGRSLPGGFAGVALRRRLRRSGPHTASSVSPLSPLAMLWSSCSSVLQASEGSWLLSSASLGVLWPESLVLCLSVS
ncbi:unnamed protein product [Brassica rapa]|uniref:Uncharacterized protein n=2 Tax=Brassica campestris TaxID=3711 RepID=A0A8D9DCG8_BRACM|nr:unnamed protein product [Brassica rapa]